MAIFAKFINDEKDGTKYFAHEIFTKLSKNEACHLYINDMNQP